MLLFEPLEPRLFLSVGYPGDLNGDGVVDRQDLSSVQNADQYIAVKRHFTEADNPAVLQTLEEPDAVVVVGTEGPDEIRVTRIGGQLQINGVEFPDKPLTINARGGDDLVTVVGGGSQVVVGGDGRDVVWADSADLVSAEVVNLCPNWVIAGTSVPLPLYTPATENLAGNPLFSGTPTYDDIRQGEFGTCYLLATLATIASETPQWLTDHVVDFGDGTFGVMLADGPQWVDSRFPVDGVKLTPDGELWPKVVEKAYAVSKRMGYADIWNGGWPDKAMYDLLGTINLSTYGNFTEYAAAGLDQGRPTVVCTIVSTHPYNPLIDGHAYAVIDISEAGVLVYDPYGHDYRADYDSNPEDGLYLLAPADFDAWFYQLTISGTGLLI